MWNCFPACYKSYAFKAVVGKSGLLFALSSHEQLVSAPST